MTRRSHKWQKPEQPRPTPGLLAAIEGLYDAIDIVRRELKAAMAAPPEDIWIHQKDSPLGARRHCKLAREKKAQGHPGAAITASREHLLTQDVISEYLRGLPEPPSREREAVAVDRSRRDAIDAEWRQIDERVEATRVWRQALGREPNGRDWHYWDRKLDKREVKYLPDGMDRFFLRMHGHDLIRGNEPDGWAERELRDRGCWRADRQAPAQSSWPRAPQSRPPPGPPPQQQTSAQKWRGKLRADGLLQQPPPPAPAPPAKDAAPTLPRPDAIAAEWRQLDAQLEATRAWKAQLGREPTRPEYGHWMRRVTHRTERFMPDFNDWFYINEYCRAVLRGNAPDPAVEQQLTDRGLWRGDDRPRLEIGAGV